MGMSAHATTTTTTTPATAAAAATTTTRLEISRPAGWTLDINN